MNESTKQMAAEQEAKAQQQRQRERSYTRSIQGSALGYADAQCNEADPTPITVSELRKRQRVLKERLDRLTAQCQNIDVLLALWEDC